jgi:hypothetical protein
MGRRRLAATAHGINALTAFFAKKVLPALIVVFLDGLKKH